MEKLNNTYNVQDKNVLVTGASKGLGEQIAVELLEKGAYVIGASRSGPPESFKPYIEQKKADYQLGDLLNNSDQVVQSVYQDSQGFEVLVNNAGSFSSDYFTHLDAQKVKNDIDLDLTSPLLLHHSWFDHYNKDSDARPPELSVNICSISSFYAWPGGTAYQAAKSGIAAAIYGMRAMQRNLTAEADDDVRRQIGPSANLKTRFLAIYPDNIATGLISRAQSESLYPVKGDKLPTSMVVDTIIKAIEGDDNYGKYDDIALLVNPNDPNTGDSLEGVYAAFIPIDQETQRPNFAKRILEKVAEKDVLIQE